MVSGKISISNKNALIQAKWYFFLKHKQLWYDNVWLLWEVYLKSSCAEQRFLNKQFVFFTLILDRMKISFSDWWQNYGEFDCFMVFIYMGERCRLFVFVSKVKNAKMRDIL